MIVMMSPRQEVFEAIPLNAAALLEASTPLIVSNGSAEQDDGNDESPGEFSRYYEYKCSALFLGLLVGFFIQFSTLVANFLVIHNWAEDILSKSPNDIVRFAFVWSFFTSTMSIIILAFVRNIVSTTYTISLSGSSNKERVEDLILLLECLFVVGALIGLCVAWTATDLLVGAHAQAIYSAAMLAASLIWCKVVISWLCSKEEKDTDDSSQEPEINV